MLPPEHAKMPKYQKATANCLQNSQNINFRCHAIAIVFPLLLATCYLPNRVAATSGQNIRAPLSYIQVHIKIVTYCQRFVWQTAARFGVWGVYSKG